MIIDDLFENLADRATAKAIAQELQKEIQDLKIARQGKTNPHHIQSLQTNIHELMGNLRDLGYFYDEPTGNIKALTSEDLRKWFKEKWVRFGPDGKIRGACARGSESEGKPKCLPQAKAHALGKKGRASAAAKKRREDPNPERRGAAKNVATQVREQELDEKQDACYHKVKSRYKVWPSAYASGALVQCRKKGAANWGNKTKKE